ncbi:MAG: GntR family transcriptional regulator [Alphaproteobacteria bacterium]|nr:GntR family transcriptional regulator [Alphaproteobacteria bacterium]
MANETPSSAMDSESARPMSRSGDNAAKRSRVTEAVYERLLSKILEQELAPGTMVSELSLARQLGVSRTPVHRAIRELIADGLIVERGRKRPVIATFSGEDVTDLFEMRKLLEGEAAYRAATRIDRPALTKLREMASQIRRSLRRPGLLDRWTAFDESFHQKIAQCAGSARLQADIARYRLIHRGLNRTLFTQELVPQALGEHEAILDALERRDAMRARNAMIRHIAEWAAFYASSLR